MSFNEYNICSIILKNAQWVAKLVLIDKVFMDYLKKSLKKLNIIKDYDEVDTKIASGWYVEPIDGN